MATVVPPPPPSAPPPATPGTPILTVSNPPPALLSTAVNARLDAQVMAQLGQGKYQLHTPLGPVTVRSAQVLPSDATLSLLVRAITPQVKLQVASINGHPLTQAAARPMGTPTMAPTAMTAPQGGTSGPAAPTGQLNVSLTAGTETIATVLRPPSGALGRMAPTSLNTATAPAPTNTASPPPGAQASTPATDTAPRTGSAPTQGSGQAGPTAPPSAGSSQTQQTALFPRQGVQMPVRIVTVQPPAPNTPIAPPAPAATPLSPGTSLQGVITQATPAGGSVVSTPIGELMLPIRSALPPGTSVRLTITGAPIQATVNPGSTLPSAASLIMNSDWPAMRDALQTLARTSPETARHLTTQVLPRPDGQMAAAMMIFMTALRSSDLRSWFGDAASRVLDRSRGDITTRLGDDFAGFARVADSSPQSDWRSYLIPFHNGQDIDPIRLHLRKDDEEEDDTRSSGKRFLVDVTLTTFGRIQLDGLVKSREKHMDLIVRSDRPFPATMRTDIQTIFANAAEITGMKGGLSFQADPPQFVDIIIRDPSDDEAGVLV